MLPILLSVVVISLSGVMAPGPMFAVTLAKSYKSPWAGLQIALGHAVIEVPLILLINFGIKQIFQNNLTQVLLSIIGGAMILWMGIGMFRSRNSIVQGGKDKTYNALTAGIVMSGLNPFFLMWWATTGALLIMKFVVYGALGLVVLIIVHWLCDGVWLSLVSATVYKTHSLWGNHFQEWLFIGCSLFLAGFGVWYIYSGIQLAI